MKLFSNDGYAPVFLGVSGYRLSDVCKESVEVNHEIKNIDYAIEEMSELMKTLIKYKRSAYYCHGHLDTDDCVEAIKEELCDVFIQCFQLAQRFGDDSITKLLKQKLDRLDNWNKEG